MAEWLRDNDQVQIGPCPCIVELFEQLARAANGPRPDAMRHDAKSADFLNVFKNRSEMSRLSERLRSLRNFSLSECDCHLSVHSLQLSHGCG
jgi:hypothetical protein